MSPGRKEVHGRVVRGSAEGLPAGCLEATWDLSRCTPMFLSSGCQGLCVGPQGGLWMGCCSCQQAGCRSWPTRAVI
eukprot:6239114-Alexandrium_andersonii.AAC.1